MKLDLEQGTVDVTRLARSVGIKHRCLMAGSILGEHQELDGDSLQEVAAATAMEILFWLRRAWAVGQDERPPVAFQPRGGRFEGKDLAVTEVEGSILVSVAEPTREEG
ncbi:MAG: hypothetical protein E6R08_01035 [Nevskiaceae bacterium]|nr:MAG: hypothetical protein E6R08_01035 [Nevskiaceae bacterium]